MVVTAHLRELKISALELLPDLVKSQDFCSYYSKIRPTIR
jgi:hypothetical protein